MTTLRGPADPDAFRVKVGYARRYLDHLDPDAYRPTPMVDSVPAMSTIKGAEGKGGLIPWTAKNVATSAVDDAHIWQQMDRDAALTYLGAAGDRARDKAAGRGTNVHLYIERLIDGTLTGWDDALAGTEYRPAIEQFVTEWAPELKFAEVVAFGNVDGDEWGGTFDAILGLGPLGDTMVDYKSRSVDANNPHTVYSGEVAQLGGYASADYIIVEVDGVAVRRPMPHLDGLALVTFTPDAYVVHPIDLELAADTFRRLHGWWKGEQIARKAVGNKKARPASAGPPPLTDLTKAELLDLAAARGVTVTKSSTKAVLAAALSAEPEQPADVELEQPAPIDRDELRRRATTLLDNGDAADTLRRRWPTDTPGITDATDDQLPAILTAIERAEADIGAPFDPPPTPPPTPRSSSTPPAAPTIDEGPDVSPDDIATVRNAYIMAEPDATAWLTTIAGAAGNLSLEQRPSARRARIGYALVRMAVAGWHDNELLAAVINHAAVTTTTVTADTVGTTLAGLSAEHGKRVSDVVTELVEDRLKFTVDATRPDGPLQLTAV